MGPLRPRRRVPAVRPDFGHFADPGPVV